MMNDPKQTEPTDAMVEAAAKRMFARRMEAEKANHSTWAWRYQVQREELLLDAKAALTATQNAQKSERVEAQFKRGDRVTKKSGSSWTGIVVGEYSTSLTPEGYAIESETEVGSVQIYPAKAVRALIDGEQL